MPIKCPVAPLEFAFLADWYLRERGIRDRTELVLLDAARQRVHEADLRRAPLRSCSTRKRSSSSPSSAPARSTAPAASSAPTTAASSTSTCSSPSRSTAAPPIVDRSPGLGDALGFVPTDKRTLQTTVKPNVFALGDATDLPTSKAGSVTHFEAEVLSENIARYLADQELEQGFDGHANCFIETGFHKALLIDFNYETEPLPGHFPTAFGLPLLRESRLNHLGKLAFQWVYWHALLPGREIPGIGPAMPTRGKKGLPVHV